MTSPDQNPLLARRHPSPRRALRQTRLGLAKAPQSRRSPPKGRRYSAGVSCYSGSARDAHGPLSDRPAASPTTHADALPLTTGGGHRRVGQGRRARGAAGRRVSSCESRCTRIAYGVSLPYRLAFVFKASGISGGGLNAYVAGCCSKRLRADKSPGVQDTDSLTIELPCAGALSGAHARNAAFEFFPNPALKTQF